MKAIKRKNFVLASLTYFGILTGVMLLVFERGVSEPYAMIPLASIMIASAVVTGVWLRGLSKLKPVRLNAENSILHICIAVINDLSGNRSGGAL